MVATPMRVIISALMVLGFVWTAWSACFKPAVQFAGLREAAQAACRSEPTCKSVTLRTTVKWLDVGRSITFNLSSRNSEKVARALQDALRQRFESGIDVVVVAADAGNKGGAKR